VRDLPDFPDLPVHGLGRAWTENASERLDALEPVEQALLSARATSKRRDEFVAGRLAAHDALEQLSESTLSGRRPGQSGEWRAFAVLAEVGERQGCPKVVDAGLRPLPIHVSISHCESLAIAVAASVPVGIDLVRVEPQPAGFADEAFDPRELASWAVALDLDADHPEVLAHAFAAKEALVKWIGQGFGLALRDVMTIPEAPIDREGDRRAHVIGEWSGKRQRFVVRRWFEDELLVLLWFAAS
jgi:4'-phosphopantetheinyl transferase